MANQWDEMGLVVGSKYRLSVLDQLDDGPRTPSAIASNTGADLSNVSRALQQLREEGLAELLVAESRRKGRIYGITDRGEEIHDRIENHGLD